MDKEKVFIFATRTFWMMDKDKFILNKIKNVVQEVVPKGSEVFLFGSRARGDAREDSDWDILIILPKELLMQTDYDEVSFPLVELGWKLNVQINPIMYTKGEWEAYSITPFYDNVIRDGIQLVA